MSENIFKPNEELTSESTALGFFYNRSGAGTQPVGCGFSVGDKLAVAPATSMLPYTSAPRMLRMYFPYANRNLCADEIILHPQFDRSSIERSIEQGLLLSSAELVCSEYNCCLVRLTDKAPALYESDLNDVQAALQFPLTPENNDLSGSLNDLDLSLVIQTLNSARKQGILYLFDEQGSPAAQIFCSDGKVNSARFGPLTGALAVYQILEKRTVVNFGFYPSVRGEHWPANLISGSTDMLLIEGMRRLDEIINLKQRFKIGDASYFARRTQRCDLQLISQELQTTAMRLWEVLDGLVSVNELWWMVFTDDYLLYKTIGELLSSQQITEVAAHSLLTLPGESNERSAVGIFKVGPSQRQLQAGSRVDSLTLEVKTNYLRQRSGILVAQDPGRYLHNIRLTPSTVGTPILMANEVVGLNLGQRPEHDGTEQLCKMIPCSVIRALMTQKSEVVETTRFEQNVRTIVKPPKRRPRKIADWKLTLLWFVVGFIIVVGLRAVSEMLGH
ncbi:MAG TPA: DUF4388 domain-containing protein [Drouetiella sp.]|jgi:Domain of unknown function (DUF4388)